MNRTELIDLHNTLSTKARVLMKEKNADYSGSTGEVFANFEACKSLGVDPITGILMRMTDKLSRISSFVERGELQVKGEGVEDSALDLINYAVSIAGMVKDDTVIGVHWEGGMDDKAMKLRKSVGLEERAMRQKALNMAMDV